MVEPAYAEYPGYRYVTRVLAYGLDEAFGPFEEKGQ